MSVLPLQVPIKPATHLTRGSLVDDSRDRSHLVCVRSKEIRRFTAEAEQVDLMTRHPGWEIIRRDVDDYRQKIAAKIPYLNPRGAIYEDTRILYLASDKLLGIIEDYAANRKKAIELLDKIDNPQENIVLDVDNE